MFQLIQLPGLASVLFFFIFASIQFSAASASADQKGKSQRSSTARHLTPGSYARTRGDADLCPGFPLSGRVGKELVLGRYRFHTEPSTADVESDLDKNCRFLEEQTRQDLDSATIFSRRNIHRCHGKNVSDILIIATIKPGEITLSIKQTDIEDGKTTTYPDDHCAWKLKGSAHSK